MKFFLCLIIGVILVLRLSICPFRSNFALFFHPSKLKYNTIYFQLICNQTPRFTIGDCAAGHRADNRDKNRNVLIVPRKHLLIICNVKKTFFRSGSSSYNQH